MRREVDNAVVIRVDRRWSDLLTAWPERLVNPSQTLVMCLNVVREVRTDTLRNVV